MPVELQNHALLVLRYEGVDYPLVGYFMPQAFLHRAVLSPGVLKVHDAADGARLQSEVVSKLDHIYHTVILPGDIKALAGLNKDTQPKRRNPNILDITRMFG